MDYLNFSPGTWIMLYFGVWILAVAWSVVISLLSKKHPKIEKVRDSGIAILAVADGMVAVAFVSIGLKLSLGLFIMLVLAAGAAAVGISSFILGDKLAERR